MKNLLIVLTLAILAFSSCEKEYASVEEFDNLQIDKSANVEIDGVVKLVELSNALVRQKGESVVNENELIRIAEMEQVDLFEIGNEMAKYVAYMRSKGLTEEDITNQFVAAHLSAKSNAANAVGTPCYDTYVDNITTTYAAFTSCVIIGVATAGPAAVLGCAVGAAIGQATALIKYETCLDNNYGGGK